MAATTDVLVLIVQEGQADEANGLLWSSEHDFRSSNHLLTVVDNATGFAMLPHVVVEQDIEADFLARLKALQELADDDKEVESILGRLLNSVCLDIHPRDLSFHSFHSFHSSEDGRETCAVFLTLSNAGNHRPAIPLSSYAEFAGTNWLHLLGNDPGFVDGVDHTNKNGTTTKRPLLHPRQDHLRGAILAKLSQIGWIKHAEKKMWKKKKKNMGRRHDAFVGLVMTAPTEEDLQQHGDSLGLKKVPYLLMMLDYQAILRFPGGHALYGPNPTAQEILNHGLRELEEETGLVLAGDELAEFKTKMGHWEAPAYRSVHCIASIIDFDINLWKHRGPAPCLGEVGGVVWLPLTAHETSVCHHAPHSELDACGPVTYRGIVHEQLYLALGLLLEVAADADVAGLKELRARHLETGELRHFSKKW